MCGGVYVCGYICVYVYACYSSKSDDTLKYINIQKTKVFKFKFITNVLYARTLFHKIIINIKVEFKCIYFIKIHINISSKVLKFK